LELADLSCTHSSQLAESIAAIYRHETPVASIVPGFDTASRVISAKGSRMFLAHYDLLLLDHFSITFVSMPLKRSRPSPNTQVLFD
jgi:hypothetical protein